MVRGFPSQISGQKKNDVQMDTTVSVDHYNHLEEDVQLMVDLGLKAYRFSINWTRVLPNGDLSKINDEGVQFYHRLLDLLIKNNIEPIVTMFHFDFPYALVEKYDGWVSKNAIEDFYAYASFLIKEFGGKVRYWLTINEQNVMVGQPEILGIEDENKTELYRKSQIANINMCVAQAKVFKLVREKYPDLKIGPAVSYITALPENGESQNVLLAKTVEDMFSFSLMDISLRGNLPKSLMNVLEEAGIENYISDEEKSILKEGTANYLAVNWYCTTTFKLKGSFDPKTPQLENLEIVKNPNLDYTKWNWSFDPIGLRYAMQQLNDRYPNVEIIITECGWSEEETLEDGQVHDSKRVSYLKEHIKQLGLSIYDGVNIIGFCPWSFIDLLSVNDGMEKRYGLVYVDRDNFNKKTLNRYRKDSFYYYKEVIKSNGKMILSKDD